MTITFLNQLLLCVSHFPTDFKTIFNLMCFRIITKTFFWLTMTEREREKEREGVYFVFSCMRQNHILVLLHAIKWSITFIYRTKMTIKQLHKITLCLIPILKYCYNSSLSSWFCFGFLRHNTYFVMMIWKFEALLFKFNRITFYSFHSYWKYQIDIRNYKMHSHIDYANNFSSLQILWLGEI